MKINKVLLGLFAGVLSLVGGAVMAQNDDGNRFYEIGPSNVGGQVSSLVVNQMDADHVTLFAGAYTGGVYVKSDNFSALEALYHSRGMDVQLATNLDSWHFVPYFDGEREDILPVSAMVQGPAPDYTIFVGTGDDRYKLGSTYDRMSVLGKGLYRLNPEDYSFNLIPGTKPTSASSNFAAIHAIDYLYRNNTLYLLVATNNGLYRWTVSDDNWSSATPECIFTGNVEQLVVAAQIKMAYFSVGGNLYKISDVSAATINPIDITNTNSAFGQAGSHLKLAVSSSDPSYFYAVVISASGIMQNVYLTRNMQDWTTLATSTVMPFTTNSGAVCGDIVVDPGNPRHIYIGGSTIWSGTGFTDGGYYQWMKSSSSEFELNAGDYMQYVYNNSMFAHSGVQKILPVYRAAQGLNYYIATNGGVYSTVSFGVFNNINNGLNNLQINGLAVAADGSLISGANDNACPFIESRMGHNGGTFHATWYDDGSLGNTNHDAVVLWTSSGGQVAASSYQQLAPQMRRNIIVSSEKGRAGRAFADYMDYTQTQTWTSNSAFLTRDLAGGGPVVSQMCFWETDHDTLFNDSIDVLIDTMGYVLRQVSGTDYDTVWFALPGTTRAVRIVRAENARDNDTIPVGTGRGASFRLLPGDKLTVLSTPTAEYPFTYTIKKAQRTNEALRVKNPMQSRLMVVARDSSNSKKWGVYLSWTPTDFTRVFDINNMESSLWDGLLLWAPLFTSNTALGSQVNYIPRTMAISEDARAVFVAVTDTAHNQSYIVRLRGFENVDYSRNVLEIQEQISGPQSARMTTVLTMDTFYLTPGDRFFPRVISSMTVDGEKLILTFEGYNENYANVAIIDNILDDSWSVSEKAITGKKGLPVYCSMVEKTTGKVYFGTAEGVTILNSLNGNSWSTYENIYGVPVTSIVQQKSDLPVRRHIGHNGINQLDYVFAKTKWPNAIYFGTYGRGIFLDMQYVTDTVNEVSEPQDWVSIPTVANTGMNSVSVYPNPVFGDATLSLTTAVAGQAILRVYDLNGRVVVDRNLGHVSEGQQTFTVSTEGMSKGMYLVNVFVAGQTAATKMMVR